MDDNTTKLLQDLANKLGTTAEHLWAVLIRQAPISAAFDLIGWISCIGILSAVFFVLLRIKTPDDSDDNFWWECGRPLWVLISAVAIIFFFVGFMESLPVDMAGFFNPEYWAFKQIVK